MDHFFEISKASSLESDRDFRKLRNHKYDLIFCPHPSFRSFFWMLQIPSTKKITFTTWWKVILSILSFQFSKFVFVKRSADLPDALRQLSLFSSFDLKLKEDIEAQKKTSLFESPVPAWASMGLFDNRSSINSKTIVIAPGSQWATKRWTEDGYGQLAARFVTQGYSVVLTGQSDEAELCERVKKKALQVLHNQNFEGRPDSKVISEAGNLSLSQMIELLKSARLLVSNDSGAMHLASLVNLATVTVFGPTTLDLGYRPWQNHAVVVQKDLSCRPCGKHGHDQCPIGTHACMKGVDVDLVGRSCEELLKRSSSVSY